MSWIFVDPSKNVAQLSVRLHGRVTSFLLFFFFNLNYWNSIFSIRECVLHGVFPCFSHGLSSASGPYRYPHDSNQYHAGLLLQAGTV